jgi:hypothetical protein
MQGQYRGGGKDGVGEKVRRSTEAERVAVYLGEVVNPQSRRDADAAPARFVETQGFEVAFAEKRSMQKNMDQAESSTANIIRPALQMVIRLTVN